MMSNCLRILVVDDEAKILELYQKVFSPQEGFQDSESGAEDHLVEFIGERVPDTSFRNLEPTPCYKSCEAVEAVKKSLEENKRFAVAFIDVRLSSGTDGVNTARRIRLLDPDINIMMVTGHYDVNPQEIVSKVPPADKLFYIQKPFFPHEIRQFALALGAKWKMERQLRKLRLGLEAEVKKKTYDLTKSNKELQAKIKERKWMEEILLSIDESTAGVTGEEFLRCLVKRLATVFGFRYAFVGEVLLPVRNCIKTLTMWEDGDYVENIVYDLAGTPCADVVGQKFCFYPKSVRQKFPQDYLLVEMGVESYMGTPLIDSSGNVTGILATMHDKPMDDLSFFEPIMKIIATRAMAEIERKKAEKSLQEETYLKRVLLDNMSCNALLIRPETREIVVSNKAAAETGAVPGKKCYEALGQSDEPCSHCLAPEAWTTGKKIYSEVNISGVILDTHWVPITKDLYLHYAFDITERKQGEKKLRNALAEVEQLKNRLQAENVYLQNEIKSEHNFEEIICRDGKFKEVLDKVAQVAPTDSTVLVLGETGTGKELLARAIHNISARKDRPLVKVDCAALPANLIESELFGHEKGAFTGAGARRIGRFELAHGGTVFLDEIGELPLELQVKLLRVLQDGELERLGSMRTVKVDVRIIAATNRNLKQAVEAGSFRQDLYYRLNVFPITTLPLRRRTDDIPLLVSHFTKKYSTKTGKKIESIPQNMMDSLQTYHWPGNIRELENIIERAVVLARGSHLELDDFFDRQSPMEQRGKPLTLRENERSFIIKMLEQSNWVIQGPDGAAARLGLPPSTLRSRMQKLGIKRSL
jgi:transcriptional regulator with GAF, ATPase, and Fis domain/DNA-binding response OmpR family regulator/PAS domain-containing protein